MARRVEISKRFEKLASRLTNVATVRVLNRAAPRIRDFIRSTFMGASKTTGSRLARNTGAMERHTTFTRAEKEPDRSTAQIKINVPYATTHFTDKGKRVTIIKPVTAKALTIPILKNAQQRAPKAARDYKRRFAFGGVLYAAERNNGVFPIFALRSMVKVPTRVDIQKQVQPTAERIIKEELQVEIDAALKRN
jgi:hypothetical protein